MRIDVWSDIVCPFCHLGRRHLELALADFPQADEVEVIWHSYELDRNAPKVGTDKVIDQVAAKYGVSREQMVITHEQMAQAAAEVGLDFAWEKLVPSNSYDAHRLIHAARAEGVEEAVTTRIMRGWYAEGRAIGDPAVLRELAVEGGLRPQVVDLVLASDDHGIDVRTDEAVAAQIGITGVPTFVLDQKYAVTGAQPPQLLLQAIEHAWADQGNRPEAAAGGCGGGCCGGGGCGGESATDQVCSTDASGGCGDSGCGDSGCGDGGCGAGGCGGICGADEEPVHSEGASPQREPAREVHA